MLALTLVLRSLLQCQRAQWEEGWSTLDRVPLLADLMPRVRYMFRNLSQQYACDFDQPELSVLNAFAGTAPRLLSFSVEPQTVGSLCQERVVLYVKSFEYQSLQSLQSFEYGPAFKAYPLSEFLEFFKKVVDD